MKQIKIEYLCPELCHFYGDAGNLLYIEEKARLMGNSAEVIKTSQFDVPLFAKGECDMVYIGATTEEYVFDVAKYLIKYKAELTEYIENGGYVLATGNTLECFYESIEKEDGSIFECLGMFPLHAVQFYGKRHSYNVIARYDDRITVAGYKNLCSYTKEDKYDNYLFSVIRQAGKNVSGVYEGIHYKNLFATYLLGPVLLQNPDFSDEILKGLFKEDFVKVRIPFETEAHEKRVDDVMNSKNPDGNG
ncbi:MAG: hypothetical protein E7218_07525 [Anaerofustis stercorihominis]|nr:hypothetical protein [Anaerofustis stercorihominis]